MDGQPLVRRELLDEGLADELVTEPVARAGDDQDPRAQGDVEQRERLRFRGADQRHDAGGIEIVARQRQPPKHRQRALVEVEEPGCDGVSGRRDERRDTRDGASGQLEREEGVALREIDDPIDDLGCPRRRRAHCYERGRILRIERPEVDLHGLAGPRQPRHSPGQDLGCRLRAVREHGQDRGPAGGAEVVQDIDRGFVREVRVVEDQRDRGAIAGGQEQTAERPDHPVASERALQRRGRRGQRGQLGQHRAPPTADGVEQRPVPGYELLGHAREGRIRDARLGGRDGDRHPTLGPCHPCHLPAERRLADACRATHDKRAEPAPRLRPQQSGSPRQLELAAHERGFGDPQPRDALVVDRLGVAARQDPQLASQGGSEPPVPADRGGATASRQVAPHQLPVRQFVGGLNLDQPLPLATATQQLHIL